MELPTAMTDMETEFTSYLQRGKQIMMIRKAVNRYFKAGASYTEECFPVFFLLSKYFIFILSTFYFFINFLTKVNFVFNINNID